MKIRPLYQTVTAFDPDSLVEMGDCWRTCVAMLLGLDHPLDVPNFAHFAETHCGRWNAALCHVWMRDWLRENTEFDITIWEGKPDFPVWGIATIASRNGPWNHCVIMRSDTGQYVDPQPLNWGHNYDIDDVFLWELLVYPYEPSPQEWWRMSLFPDPKGVRFGLPAHTIPEEDQ